MPRHARAILPEVAVHIIQRGNNRSACFHRDADYLVYLDHLRELSQRHGCEIHAYCLMTNHVHLLATPRAANACALLMKNLGQRYVQYVNRSRERTGTLWEGRFRSCIAQSERYVMACYRYIELNPVRAGMVARAGDYRWSSYLANAGGVRATGSHPIRNTSRSVWTTTRAMPPIARWSPPASARTSWPRSAPRPTAAARSATRRSAAWPRAPSAGA